MVAVDNHLAKAGRVEAVHLQVVALLASMDHNARTEAWVTKPIAMSARQTAAKLAIASLRATTHVGSSAFTHA